MPVILAEKPSQAQAYAEAFPRGKKGEGYITIPSCALFPTGATLTWAVGHLVELRAPAEYDSAWKRWNLSQLPMLPEKFEFKTSYKTRKQFQVVRRLLKEAGEIIVATDCDREGENIARSIILQAGASHKPTKRLWINSLEKDEVYKGFSMLKDGQPYLHLYAEAQARQISDWLVGMNASRLYTLLLQKRGIQQVFSVGRVQTPTLKLIYNRQKEIENFKPEPFFEIKSLFETEAGKYEGRVKGRCKTEKEAEEMLNRHGIESTDKGIIKEVKVSRKREKPPKLHSLSTLQTLANKKYKYSPSKTLEIVQSLYDQPLKLITYPRTDTQHITKNEFAYLKSNFYRYQDLTGDRFDPMSMAPKKRYVDDSKVKEHYAIIPTKKVPSAVSLEKLRPDQRKIYFEIIKSVLAMFHNDYEYDETSVVTDVKGLSFHSKGRVEKVKGWKELYAQAKSGRQIKHQEQALPPLQEGMPASAVINIEKNMTKPPKPYTEGQLINMMKTCGRMIEDDEEAKAVLKEVEGLGTEATRSGIIKTLKRQEYIQVQKNVVHVTRKGEILCKAVEGTLLSKPEMTAKWEKFLKRIGQGEAEKQTFIQHTSAFMTKLVESAPEDISRLDVNRDQLPERNHNANLKKAGAPIARCPACKEGSIIQHKNFYGCSQYKQGCKQTFNRTILGKQISKTQIRNLCEKGETHVIKGFKGKRVFDAKLVLKNGKAEFSFS